MQTFLPYPSFEESARVLDRQRLGKQRVEALQIYRALTIPSYGWKHHPAAKMWTGHLDALALYHDTMLLEWERRGYLNNMHFLQAPVSWWPCIPPSNPKMPPWLGDPAFHLSHQSNLVRKLPSHYRQFWLSIPDNLPYVWPKVFP